MNYSFIGKSRALAVATFVSLLAATPVQAEGLGPCYLSQSTLRVVGLSLQNAQAMYDHPSAFTYLPWCDPLQGVFLGDLDLNGNGLVDALELSPSPSVAPSPQPTTGPSQTPNSTAPTPAAGKTAAPTASSAPLSPAPVASASPAAQKADSKKPAVTLAAAKTNDGTVFLAAATMLLIAIVAGWRWWTRRSKP